VALLLQKSLSFSAIKYNCKKGKIIAPTPTYERREAMEDE